MKRCSHPHIIYHFNFCYSMSTGSVVLKKLAQRKLFLKKHRNLNCPGNVLDLSVNVYVISLCNLGNVVTLHTPPPSPRQAGLCYPFHSYSSSQASRAVLSFSLLLLLPGKQGCVIPHTPPFFKLAELCYRPHSSSFSQPSLPERRRRIEKDNIALLG